MDCVTLRRMARVNSAAIFRSKTCPFSQLERSVTQSSHVCRRFVAELKLSDEWVRDMMDA